MDRASKWHPSPEWTKGVPCCTEDRCPEYDGKRCKMMGFRPCRICEPVVQQMSDDISAASQTEELLRDREKDLEFEHGRSEAFEGACEAIAEVLGWPEMPHPEDADRLVAAVTALVARVEESEADNRVLAEESKFADIAALVVKDAKAKNYVEVQLNASDGSEYVLTFQRRDGETPHQLRAKADAEVARLRELLREWWESSKLSCGDGAFIAWHDSFSRRVKTAIVDVDESPSAAGRPEISSKESPGAELLGWFRGAVADGTVSSYDVDRPKAAVKALVAEVDAASERAVRAEALAGVAMANNERNKGCVEKAEAAAVMWKERAERAREALLCAVDDQSVEWSPDVAEALSDDPPKLVKP